jgi:hypothetical protein
MKKSYLIKTLICIAVIAMVGFGEVWAQSTPATETIATGALIWHFIVSILAWIWIFFANIAGTLLTNERVYGGVIGMDSYLWRIRNMVRNICNYAL